jgi:hypothetical protein
MGLFDKAKGFLNIGGPKIEIVSVETPITGRTGEVRGALQISTKRAARLATCTQRFIYEVEIKEGGEKQTERGVIAEQLYAINADIPEGGVHERMIYLAYDATDIAERFADKSRSNAGKLEKALDWAIRMTSGPPPKYFVEIECDVVGTPIDPSDRREVEVRFDG